MNELSTFPAGHHGQGKMMEVAVRGEWREVPSIVVRGQTLIVTGDWIRFASLHSEDWVEDELKDPAACVDTFRKNPKAPRADILRFSQKVAEPIRRYQYPFEMRSIAVAEVADFDKWWMSLPQETRKNARRSQKRGVVIKVKGVRRRRCSGNRRRTERNPHPAGEAVPSLWKVTRARSAGSRRVHRSE